MTKLNLKVKQLENFYNLKQRGQGDAGIDLYATEACIIEPGEQVLVKAGISVSFSADYYLRIAPRSGLAYKNGIDVMAGVIDSSYRGEIGVILRNHSAQPAADDGTKDFFIKRGDRIAQMIPECISQEDFIIVENLDESDRGIGGFGSTGVRDE
jgi:dUTP pyrophosphatase